MSNSPEYEAAEKAYPLTEREKALRNQFVDEYLTDYDAYKAALRIGYSPAFAKDFSIKFMEEPYVLQRIKAMESTPETEADIEIEKKKIVAALWREANNRGAGSSQAARVAALAKLSAFYGMDAPTRSKQELTGADGQPLNGGVFVVPGIMTADDWAKMAEAQQEELTRPEVGSGPKLVAQS